MDRDRLVRLTDDEWAHLEPLLPRIGRTKTTAGGERSTVEAILYVLVTGCPWAGIPEAYGMSVGTVYRRFVRWQGEGVWPALWAALRASMSPEERARWADAFFDAALLPATSVRTPSRGGHQAKRVDRRAVQAAPRG